MNEKARSFWRNLMVAGLGAWAWLHPFSSLTRRPKDFILLKITEGFYRQTTSKHITWVLPQATLVAMMFISSLNKSQEAAYSCNVMTGKHLWASENRYSYSGIRFLWVSKTKRLFFLFLSLLFNKNGVLSFFLSFTRWSIWFVDGFVFLSTV